MSVGLDPLLSNPQTGPGNQAQVDAVKGILGLGGGALALGAGARGIAGLGSWLDRELGGPAKTPQRQSYVRIPVPVRVRSRAEREAMLAANLANIDKEAGFVKLAEDALDWASRNIADVGGLLRQPGEAGNAIQRNIGGWGQAHPMQMPWAWPAAAVAGAGGLYGGWKLTDYLLDKTRGTEQESELAQAKREYETALAGRRKVASAIDPLDELADCYEAGLEKRALGNELIGAALLAGLGTAGLAGLGTYRWTRGLAEDKAVEEAVKRRQAQIAEQAPNPIMAIPAPTPVYHYHHQRTPWQHLTGQHPDPESDALAADAMAAEAQAALGKVANVGQAADEVLGRLRSNQMAVWNRLMTPADAKPAKPVKPEPPPPPQLPTLAGKGMAGAVGPPSLGRG